MKSLQEYIVSVSKYFFYFLFCHTYANYYSHNKVVKHDHANLESFIRKLPK